MKGFHKAAVGIIGLGLCSVVHGLEFEVHNIALGHDQKVAFMPFVGPDSKVPALLVIETPDLDERERQTLGHHEEPTRTISLYRRSGASWELKLRKELDAAMDLVDTVRGNNGIGLAGYRESQVLILREESRSFEPLLFARSMYVGSNWDSSPAFDMFVDLNSDGMDDFLMPDFDGWQVSVQSEAGFADPQIIGPGPRMNFGETARFVGYRAQTPHLFDENRDGLSDIAFWINGRFEVYLQKPSGDFANAALIVDPLLNDVLGSFLSVSLGEGDDEAGQSQRTLDAVGDINGDGLADLIIQSIKGDGIFGLETQYEIHRGHIGPDNRLMFDTTASSIVSSNGIQLDNERLDLDGDGTQEFVVTSVNITLGAIIGALITRSAPVDVAIYQMTDDVFADEPTLEKRIKVRFNFSDGELFVPAVISADITGDGHKDLLVQKDEETLFVYPGEPTARLFDKTPIKLTLALPKERENFVVSDLNRDGRDELILHVRREDSSVLSVVEFGG